MALTAMLEGIALCLKAHGTARTKSSSQCMPLRVMLKALHFARRPAALLAQGATVLCMHRIVHALDAMHESLALCPAALGTAHTKSDSAVHASRCACF